MTVGSENKHQPSKSHTHDGSEAVRLWLENRLNVEDDLERVAEALNVHPELVAEVVSRRPVRVPAIRQIAAGRFGIAAMHLKFAVRREFMRSDGRSANADLLFRATLRLEGPEASELQSEMRQLIAEFDRQSALVDASSVTVKGLENRDAFQSKAGIARIAEVDPALGQLYGRVVDDPTAAAKQLQTEFVRDRTRFENHIRRLSQMFDNEPSSTKSFVRAVQALKGDAAVGVKIAIVKALQWTIPDEIQRHAGSPGMALRQNESTIRLEELVSLLAETVSQPDVARALVTAARGLDSSPAPREMLKEAMSTLLSEAYNLDTRARARSILITGVSPMLESSLSAPTAMERDLDGEVAGTFLGFAARAAANDAKHRDDVAKAMAERTKKMVDAVKSYLPAPAKYGLMVGQFLFKSGPTAAKHAPVWSDADLDRLLNAVYTAAHPAPADASSKEGTEYAAGYMQWHRVPSEAFFKAQEENK